MISAYERVLDELSSGDAMRKQSLLGNYSLLNRHFDDAKMEGTTRLAVKEAQKQGFIVTGWPGHNLNDYFLGLGLGVDAICSDVPVQVQQYIDRKQPTSAAVR